MNREEWNKTATEQNAKAEQIGAAVGVGCGVIVLLFILIFVIAAFIVG